MGIIMHFIKRTIIAVAATAFIMSTAVAEEKTAKDHGPLVVITNILLIK